VGLLRWLAVPAQNARNFHRGAAHLRGHQFDLLASPNVSARFARHALAQGKVWRSICLGHMLEVWGQLRPDGGKPKVMDCHCAHAGGFAAVRTGHALHVASGHPSLIQTYQRTCTQRLLWLGGTL
jgi:hypothetical protein